MKSTNTPMEELSVLTVQELKVLYAYRQSASPFRESVDKLLEIQKNGLAIYAKDERPVS